MHLKVIIGFQTTLEVWITKDLMNVVVAYWKTPQHCYGASEEHEDIPAGRVDRLVKRPTLDRPHVQQNC